MKFQSMTNPLSMTKGTSQAEATSNSEKIKPLALSIVEFRKSEDIRLVS